MGDAPSFSVIVPAFNAENRISAVVGSVLAQSEPGLELIVIDDGSGDRTAERARESAAGDPRVTVLSQPNAGTVAARQAGLERASGRWISFLDDDDLWLPSYLAAVAPLLREPGIGLVHSDAWVVDATDGSVGARTARERFAGSLRRWPPRLEPPEAEKALLRANFVTTCAATVSAEALVRAGGLDATIVGADDWDLWLRIVGAGFAVGSVSAPHAMLRKRPGSVGSDPVLMAANALRVLEKARERGTLTARADRIARLHAGLLRIELRQLQRPGGTWSKVGVAVSGAARRAGRKRLPWPRGISGTKASKG